MTFLLAICTEECIHGVCEEPDRCLCNKAWTGLTCDQCIKPSGCINGDCNGLENTCTCFEGWRGHLCTEPICAPGCNISNAICTKVCYNITFKLYFVSTKMINFSVK